MYNKQNKRFISDNPNEFGSISWYIESASYLGKMKQKHSKDATLRLTDCYKVIALEFDYNDNAEYHQRLDKVDCLIEELTAFRAALVDSWGKP